MRPNGEFRIINLNPYIEISNYDLEAIKKIVSIAPQEAQWYHTVERIEQKNEIAYKISGLYIPEQYTSVTEVESDSNMMIKFYKELLSEHGSEKTNHIMKHLTCWCHSHHNMSVNPSGQDRKQFQTQCENALKDKVENPQLMMIFNKKEQYYCQIFDPKYNLTFENLELYEQEYDFSWIESQSKLKFKKRKKVYIQNKTSKTKSSNQRVIDWGWGTSSFDTYFQNETDLPTNYEENLTAKFISRYKGEGEIDHTVKRALDKLKKTDSSRDVEGLITKLNSVFDISQIKMLHFLLMYDMLDVKGSNILDIVTNDEVESLETKEDLLVSIDDMIHENIVDSSSLEAAIFVASIAPKTNDLIDLLEHYDELLTNRSSLFESVTR